MKAYPAGPLSGMLKPRYKVINALVGPIDPSVDVDIFIDLNTFIDNTASSTKFLSSLPFSSNVEIDLIETTLMILKHWKGFTRGWNNMSRIFLIMNDFEMSPDMAEHSKLKSYMLPRTNKFNNDRYNQLKYYWEEAIKKLDVIFKYLPNMYFIHCNKLDSYIIPNIIPPSTRNTIRLVVSSSSLMTNYTYMPQSKVIYTRYRSTGMYQLSDPLMIVQSITHIDDDIMNAFTHNKVFYNLLNSIIGDKDRGIMGLTRMGITGFASDLMRSVERREIPQNPMTINSVLPVIDQQYHDYLKNNYPLVDIEEHKALIPESLKTEIQTNMVDLYDLDALRSCSVGGLTLMELL